MNFPPGFAGIDAAFRVRGNVKDLSGGSRVHQPRKVSAHVIQSDVKFVHDRIASGAEDMKTKPAVPDFRRPCEIGTFARSAAEDIGIFSAENSFFFFEDFLRWNSELVFQKAPELYNALFDSRVRIFAVFRLRVEAEARIFLHQRKQLPPGFDFVFDDLLHFL